MLKLLRKIFNDKKNPPEQSTQKKIKEQYIPTNLKKTIEIFKSLYHYPDNSDVYLRNLQIGGLEKKATILFINTITDSKAIEKQIIKPLLHNMKKTADISDIISVQAIHTESKISKILKEVNNGSAILFLEKSSKALIIPMADFKTRNLEKPENEVTLIGPKESFNEDVQTNISLIRKTLRNESLMVESFTISERFNNEVYVLYVKDLANEKLVNNVKERVNSLTADSVQNIAILEELIEDRPLSLFPSILYTERPDRATFYLEDGYIVLLMPNSPSSLILPATFWTFFHTSEDKYLRFLNGNFVRILRMIAIFISLFASSIYVALTEYHTEMIPVNILLSIATTREKVPFPPIVEIVLMEIAFELIREAGLRVPTPIGPTIGIVGALILGQAAVEATIVSPIVVIVVALGGVSSFAIGDLSLNFALRLMKFVFIISAALFGLFGITAVFAMGMFYLVSVKSFGVPYFTPSTPTYTSSSDTIFRKLINQDFFRPGYLKPKDMTKK